MTINELAKFSGKNRSTIWRWAHKCSGTVEDKLLQSDRSNPPNFSIAEVGDILRGGTMGEDAISVIMQNALSQNATSPLQNAPPTMDYEALAVAITASLGGLLEPLLRRMMEVAMASKAPPPTHIQIEAPLTHQTLLGYCNAHDIEDANNTNRLRSHGLILRGICGNRSLEIKRVAHERYGTINSYPIEVLEEYFSI